jgi:hypothetical protein
MKKMLFVLLAGLPFWSFGIEPLIIALNEETPSYTVPAGNVLLIETMGGEMYYFDLAFINGGKTNFVHFDTSSGGNYSSMGKTYYVSFNRPLKIPSLTRIERIDRYGNKRDCVLFCLLATPADLYASIETQSEGMLCQNGKFSFDVAAASPRPGAIKLQGSTDLSEWHDIPAAEIAKIKAGLFSASLPMAEQQKYYVKTLLTSVAQ